MEKTFREVGGSFKKHQTKIGQRACFEHQSDIGGIARWIDQNFVQAIIRLQITAVNGPSLQGPLALFVEIMPKRVAPAQRESAQ